MKSRQGIALISALLLLSAIMAIGVGMLFLSRMNLGMAENTRSGALAEARADVGVDVAMTSLNKYYKDNATFPPTFTMPRLVASTGTLTFAASDYQYARISATEYALSVLGKTINSGIYESETLVSAVAAAGSSSFPRGLISEGVVEVNGNQTLYNARLHGNQGFDLNGNGEGYNNCVGTSYDSCTKLTGTDIPISAGTKNITDLFSYTCKAKDNLCDNSTRPKSIYVKPKVNIGAPPYLSLRNDKGKTPERFGVSLLDTNLATPTLSGCTQTTSSLATSYPAGSKICVTKGISVPTNANYKDITIIVKGNLDINGSASFDNANFLSMGTLNINGNVTIKNSRLLADTKVYINGNVTYSDSATIASGGGMSLNGNIENTSASGVGLALMSLSDFDVNGNLKGKNGKLIDVAVWAGGTATVNGGADIRGGISSVGKLRINGSSTIDGLGGISNVDLATVTTTPKVLSRR